ncbi:(Dimethylallyl)adenosine tRNA methylthiotransferase MiaB [Enhygromyxa salina]|uniref:(Dimethylallyl)adenosine tRNA methylthiotransferase MiaB n=1 Tax=Enhygromyxa salina TaxID=215803 RepID=A0A2S9XX03_9BACT|nr:PhpK family radical SAM P-methyltransferase [Enhygromyxa salina]PRP97399.1 (Dimethylallyl)adenosine tRNA methylthiotransferase MiaB [Enhygromyxa salina]
MAECLIVGFYDIDIVAHERRVRAMGATTAAYQDLDLSLVWRQGRPFRALDLINHLHPDGPHLHNADFLWPAVALLGTRLSQAGHAFDYVNLPHLERESFARKLAAEDLRVVALTTTLYTHPQPILELVAFVREHRPETTIVIGGPYIAGQAKALTPELFEEQLLYLGGDIYVISAEGEAALCEIVDALARGASLDPIHNLGIRRGQRVVFSERSVEYNNLSASRVDYQLFPPGAFGRFVTTRTAKSCPFSCAFCGFPERAGRYTVLSVDEVAAELDAIAELGGVDTLTIIDDTFNVPKRRFKDILRLMIARDYGFRWNSFYRCDHGDDETLELMAAAGCEGVILGVESGSDRILEIMNKSARRKHYLRAIPRLEALGVACYASLIVGFPGETSESVSETIDLIETARPSYFRAQLWYCDPITPIYRDRERHGLCGEGFAWTHDTMDVTEACAWIEHMFLAVEGSTWQQQAGFEFWSTFYLQRHGMSPARVHAFLRSYNAAVKDRLLRPEAGRELSPARLAELRRASARVPSPAAAPAKPSAPRLSGADYRAAEGYWLEVLAEFSDRARPIELLSRERGPRAPIVRALALDDRDPLSLVAALGLAAARAARRGHALVLINDEPDAELLPVKVDADPELQWPQRLERVRAERARARTHRAYGLPLLRRPTRLARVAAEPALPDAALLDGPRGFVATLREHPELERELPIILTRTAAGQFELRARVGAATCASLVATLRERVGSSRELAPTSNEPEFHFDP